MGRPIEAAAPASANADASSDRGVGWGGAWGTSHQEMSRITGHLEELWTGYTQDGDGNPNGCEWLPVEQVANLMCQELGYEDVAEFEDALHGTFPAFLDALPHVTRRKDEATGRELFQLRPDPPRSEWRPVTMTARITSTADLWRVCLKSKHARVEIPELEFEISADGKRHIDSIYNHIAAAVYNLGNYVGQANTGLSEDHKNKIMDTVIALNILLDVEKPFTVVLHDPSGTSEYKPMEGVEVVWGDAPAAAAAGGEGGEQQQPAAAE